MKLKKLGHHIGAFLLTIAPLKVMHFIHLTATAEQPPNPLRDAVDRRVFPFGSHR